MEGLTDNYVKGFTSMGRISTCLSIACLATAGVFLFASFMITYDIGYPFWGSNVVCGMAVIVWVVVFLGFLLLTRNAEGMD
uniref:Uncharacterized protein n=1 Tax=viral metagenome TaxID=1070528 RepID=A0A6M3JZ69_9ZZZZ